MKITAKSNVVFGCRMDDALHLSDSRLAPRIPNSSAALFNNPDLSFLHTGITTMASESGAHGRGDREHSKNSHHEWSEDFGRTRERIDYADWSRRNQIFAQEFIIDRSNELAVHLTVSESVCQICNTLCLTVCPKNFNLMACHQSSADSVLLKNNRSQG